MALYLKLYTKINSKWIRPKIDVTGKIIKLLEEIMELNFHEIGSGNDFLAITPKTQVTKKKNLFKLDFMNFLPKGQCRGCGGDKLGD